MKFDFDTLIDRRGTGSYKWDEAPSDDIIPLWVADMDFRTAPAVTEALQARVAQGIFGYTMVEDDYYEALTSWFARRHGLHFTREQVIYCPGVVPAISASLKALTRPGDGVIIQTPVYNCFFSSIRNNGCRAVELPLIKVPCSDPRFFTYEMDFAALEEAASDPRNRVLLLCNPHNPCGRAWTREELHRVGEICLRHGVTVLSDEIHCDVLMPGTRFCSYGTLPKEYAERAVLFNSPSKAFNTAGLQIANIVCGNPDLRYAIDRAVNDNEVCDVNPFGPIGLKAAYTEGEEWLIQLCEYISGNYQTLCEFFADHLPWLPIAKLEATYLAWVDISSLGISSDALEELLLREAKVWLNAGSMYGDSRFLRINLACPRPRLLTALQRIISPLSTLHSPL